MKQIWLMLIEKKKDILKVWHLPLALSNHTPVALRVQGEQGNLCGVPAPSL